MPQLEKNKKLTLNIEGPFYTSYSLSIVNRNLALSLAKEGTFDTRLYSDKSISDYIPTQEELDKNPELAQIITTSDECDISIRNIYPHDGFLRMHAKTKLAFFAWEESLIPKESVEIFNSNLDGLIVMSTFVKEVCIRSGVTIPIEVIPSGVVPITTNSQEKYPLKTLKSFKFFHNSSAFPRKGVDILLRAYFKEFTSQDDVVLVIKTFPNPHNTVESQIEYLQSITPDYPETILINQDLSWDKISDLYNSIDVVVLPTRCEGFGLPQAEALTAKKPLITTAYSAHLDFCTPENSWLLDYQLEKSSSHVSSSNSVWAEPSEEDLKQKMRYLHTNIDSIEVQQRVEKGYRDIMENYSWQNVAKKFVDFILHFQQVKDLKKYNLGIVTTWNTKCGIATYAQSFYKNSIPYFNSVSFLSTLENPLIPDTKNIHRFWIQQNQIDLEKLKNIVIENQLDIIHFEYQPAFYSLTALGEYIRVLKSLNKTVFVTFHSLEEFTHTIGKDLLSKLNSIDMIYVFKSKDQEILKNLGFKKVYNISHGISTPKDNDRYTLRTAFNINSKHILSSHGFLLPHKNFHTVIESINILKETYPDIMYIMLTAIHGSNQSAIQYLDQCKRLIQELHLENNVIICEDFLTEEEVLHILHASDICILPYLETPDSASGAIRQCLVAKRPIITSDASIFQEVRNCTIQLKHNDAQSIAATVVNLFNNKNLQYELLEKTEEFINDHSWNKISAEYLESVQKTL